MVIEDTHISEYWWIQCITGFYTGVLYKSMFFLFKCHCKKTQKHKTLDSSPSNMQSQADPDMGRSHWSKVGADHGCKKQSASDVGVSYHRNP